MTKTFRLVGLDCANCAAKIENSVKKLEGVTSISINFLTTKMVLEADEASFDGVLTSATAIVKKIDPAVVLKKA